MSIYIFSVDKILTHTVYMCVKCQLILHTLYMSSMLIIFRALIHLLVSLSLSLYIYIYIYIYIYMAFNLWK